MSLNSFWFISQVYDADSFTTIQEDLRSTSQHLCGQQRWRSPKAGITIEGAEPFLEFPVLQILAPISGAFKESYTKKLKYTIDDFQNIFFELKDVIKNISSMVILRWAHWSKSHTDIVNGGGI